MNDIVFFAGTSNQSLAAEIAGGLRFKLGDIEITRFIDSECRVWVKEEIKGKKVFVLQSLSQIADQNLVELCLIGQAVKSLSAQKITAVIPWMGYSKQDKAFRRGEAVSAELIAKFIEVAGFDAVITVELHSETVTPFFKIPVTELSTHSLLATALRDEADLSRMLVASPDRGGQSRSERFAKDLDLPLIYLEKERNLITGEVTVLTISKNVENRDIIIFDDIINTGATAIKTVEFLKQNGARRIFFLATHAVLAGDASRKLAQAAFERVMVTDTIHIPPEKLFPKLVVVSVAPLLADAISEAVG